MTPIQTDKFTHIISLLLSCKWQGLILPAKLPTHFQNHIFCRDVNFLAKWSRLRICYQREATLTPKIAQKEHKMYLLNKCMKRKVLLYLWFGINYLLFICVFSLHLLYKDHDCTHFVQGQNLTGAQ
jgi:hypothetical protein